MQKLKTYQKRPVRFISLEKCGDWTVKLYSISVKREFVEPQHIESAKANLAAWLSNASCTALPTYQVATLIIHEGREGVFAIISWWVDENMLQLFAYLSSYENPGVYNLISDKGVITCVWEMAVLWFERNAWIEQVLQQPGNPNPFDNYLQQQLNTDV